MTEQHDAAVTQVGRTIRRWRSPGERDDMLQEAALSMLVSRRRGSHDDAVLARGYGAAKDERRREWRFQSRHKADLSGVETTLAGQPPTQLQAAMRKQERELLMRCVSKLSTQDQLLIRMRFVRDLELGAIGAALGVGAPCVYKRLVKVLARLRGMMRAAGVEGAATEN